MTVLARANTVITVPDATPGAGPALKFWYRAPALANTLGSATAQNAKLNLTAGPGWQQATLCLDPARARQGLHVEVALSTSGLCGRGFTEETALFDDFEATTDAACPTR
jgi:hypothetical protein